MSEIRYLAYAPISLTSSLQMRPLLSRVFCSKRYSNCLFTLIGVCRSLDFLDYGLQNVQGRQKNLQSH